MLEIVEQDRRVFEFKVTPDTPGYCKRTLSVKQLSGEPLDDEEWYAMARRVVRHLRRFGLKVTRRRFRRSQE